MVIESTEADERKARALWIERWEARFPDVTWKFAIKDDRQQTAIENIAVGLAAARAQAVDPKRGSVWIRLSSAYRDGGATLSFSAQDVGDLMQHASISDEVEEQVRIELEAAQRGREPKFPPAGRVAKQGEPHSGRVQSLTYDQNARTFRYLVKWDNGPTTSHLETDLQHEPLPAHYP